jgi:hypothetical protein
MDHHHDPPVSTMASRWEPPSRTLALLVDLLLVESSPPRCFALLVGSLLVDVPLRDTRGRDTKVANSRLSQWTRARLKPAVGCSSSLGFWVFWLIARGPSLWCRCACFHQHLFVIDCFEASMSHWDNDDRVETMKRGNRERAETRKLEQSRKHFWRETC